MSTFWALQSHPGQFQNYVARAKKINLSKSFWQFVSQSGDILRFQKMYTFNISNHHGTFYSLLKSVFCVFFHNLIRWIWEGLWAFICFYSIFLFTILTTMNVGFNSTTFLSLSSRCRWKNHEKSVWKVTIFTNWLQFFPQYLFIFHTIYFILYISIMQ